MAGLTFSGFQRKLLTQILDSLDERARNAFGQDFNTGDDSVWKQLAGSFALELDELWQALEEAYLAYTRTGAEGVHLDNFFNILGVERLGAQAANGPILIETDNRIGTSLVVQETRYTDPNDVRYTSPQVTLGNTNTFAYRLSRDDLETGQVYTATLVDDSNNLQTLTSATLSDDTAKDTFLTSLLSFWNTHITDSAAKSSITNNTLLIGIDPDNSFNILLAAAEFGLTPLTGLRYGRVNIEAQEIGRRDVPIGTEFRITPNFTGFLRALTYEDFNLGRNVETDAEYRIRASNEIRSEAIGTEDSLTTQLQVLNGVRNAVVYQNVSNIPTTEVPQSWSYHVVVAGGVNEEIGQVLHTYGPLNVAQFGNTLVNVINASGGTSPQRFSEATIRDIDIRIRYETFSGNELSAAEQTTITENFTALRNRLKIAADLQNLLLQRPVLCGLPVDRLESLTVEVKARGADDSTYTTDTQAADVFEIFDWGPENITFLRV